MEDSVCSAFERNSDGSWTCVKRVAVPGPNGPIPIEPAQTFHPGSRYRDVDVVAYLDLNCSSWMARKDLE